VGQLVGGLVRKSASPSRVLPHGRCPYGDRARRAASRHAQDPPSTQQPLNLKTKNNGSLDSGLQP
jgi:hypothetical protein